MIIDDMVRRMQLEMWAGAPCFLNAGGMVDRFFPLPHEGFSGHLDEVLGARLRPVFFQIKEAGYDGGYI